MDCPAQLGHHALAAFVTIGPSVGQPAPAVTVRRISTLLSPLPFTIPVRLAA